MTIHEIVTGVVEARNAKGIWVNGSWCNASKFAPVDLPPIGASVRVTIDAKRFIITCEVVDDGSAVSPSTATSRDQRITRLAVLKAAAGFGASRPEMKSGDVLKIAASWLAWVESD